MSFPPVQVKILPRLNCVKTMKRILDKESRSKGEGAIEKSVEGMKADEPGKEKSLGTQSPSQNLDTRVVEDGLHLL